MVLYSVQDVEVILVESSGFLPQGAHIYWGSFTYLVRRGSRTCVTNIMQAICCGNLEEETSIFTEDNQ